jgi:ribosomal protein L37AE/L43A
MPLVQSGIAYKRKFVFVPSAGEPARQRQNRTLGTHAPDGRPYEVCPMCSARASLRTEVPGDTIWKCESCGYMDSDRLGPLN